MNINEKNPQEFSNLQQLSSSAKPSSVKDLISKYEDRANSAISVKVNQTSLPLIKQSGNPESPSSKILEKIAQLGGKPQLTQVKSPTNLVISEKSQPILGKPEISEEPATTHLELKSLLINHQYPSLPEFEDAPKNQVIEKNVETTEELFDIPLMSLRESGSLSSSESIRERLLDDSSSQSESTSSNPKLILPDHQDQKGVQRSLTNLANQLTHLGRERKLSVDDNSNFDSVKRQAGLGRRRGFSQGSQNAMKAALDKIDQALKLGITEVNTKQGKIKLEQLLDNLKNSNSGIVLKRSPELETQFQTLYGQVDTIRKNTHQSALDHVQAIKNQNYTSNSDLINPKLLNQLSSLAFQGETQALLENQLIPVSAFLNDYQFSFRTETLFTTILHILKDEKAPQLLKDQMLPLVEQWMDSKLRINELRDPDNAHLLAEIGRNLPSSHQEDILKIQNKIAEILENTPPEQEYFVNISEKQTELVSQMKNASPKERAKTLNAFLEDLHSLFAQEVGKYRLSYTLQPEKNNKEIIKDQTLQTLQNTVMFFKNLILHETDRGERTKIYQFLLDLGQKAIEENKFDVANVVANSLAFADNTVDLSAKSKNILQTLLTSFAGKFDSLLKRANYENRDDGYLYYDILVRSIAIDELYPEHQERLAEVERLVPVLEKNITKLEKGITSSAENMGTLKALVSAPQTYTTDDEIYARRKVINTKV